MNENNKTRCRFGYDGNMKDVKTEVKKAVGGIELFYPIQHKELLTHLIEKFYSKRTITKRISLT